MILRVTINGEVKYNGAVGKPSLNRAIQSLVVDAKPGDLSLSRMKLW
jgi:hypothetical protein